MARYAQLPVYDAPRADGPAVRAFAAVIGHRKSTTMHDDPLWRLRHALAGVALALLAALLTAALAGRWLGDAFGGDYGMRVTIYLVLLAYVVVGAAVLFMRVAQHETQPVSVGRALRWFASLWLWPLLLLAGRRGKPPPQA